MKLFALYSRKMFFPVLQYERGFTLIEMLISLAMGLIIIAGIATVFISTSQTSSVISSRVERMGDLFLATHLMQAGLRESVSVPSVGMPILTNLTSRGVAIPTGYPASDTVFTSLPYWDAASKTLTYQNLEGNVGIFHYQHSSKDRIYWLRPLAPGVSGSKNFQELIRDLDTANGMIASPINGGISVILQSVYNNEQHQNQVASLAFNMWPRN
ncbi:MAG: prepilin-type N-terminal cleavage/methylation domain-containing protein [Mariprofundus sp.]|nr:prepilin-type N-terminal cleavage/methylation domain-containing protein [Mariprofundus sp.]